MKRTALFLAFLCSGLTSCFCQLQTIEFSPSMEGGEFKGKTSAWSTHVVTDETNKNALIIFADRDRVFYYQVDSSFNVTGQFSIDKNSMPANYYGSKYEVILQKSNHDNSFTNYIRKQNGNEIFIEKVDFKTKNSITDSYIEFSNKEKYLTAFEDNNHLYFLTLLRKTHKIRVYTDSSTEGKEIELRLDDSLAHVNLDENLRDIKIINNLKEADLFTCQNRSKLYINGNGEIALTLDSNFQYTTVFKINLNNYTSESKIVRKNSFYCNGYEDANAVETNSFIYQNKILQGVFCKNDLLLQLKDISSDSVIMEFHASRDSAISFASSDLIKREEEKKANIGTLWFVAEPTSKQTEKPLRTKEFFRAVNGSWLSFLIVSKDEHIIIKIGETHDIVRQRGGSPMFVTTGGTSFNPAGGPPVSTGHWTGPTTYSSKTGRAETYFKTILKKESLDFVPSTDIDTKYDKIDQAEDIVKEVLTAETAFDFNHKTYLFYHNKKTKKFIIEQIE